MFMDNISEKGKIITIDDLKNTLKELNIPPKSDEKLKVMLDLYNNDNKVNYYDTFKNENLLNFEDRLDFLRIKFSIKSLIAYDESSTNKLSDIKDYRSNETDKNSKNKQPANLRLL